MANNSWKDDGKLKKDLDQYVRENLKRSEILDFVKRDFPEYAWSIATLDRRLRHFEIRYIDYATSVEAVSAVVSQELNGPGKLLGYRALNQKLRTVHNVKVPRHLVHHVLAELDPDGLEARSLQKKAKKPKVAFISNGPLWVVSLDGHDKLCGYQNSTFPICIYGCLDTFSRKILFLFVCYSNSDPRIVGKKYLEYLYQEKMMPLYLRIDKGTETGKMATLHVYLVNKYDVIENPIQAIIYGPSTSNKIERWWRDLHERLEKYFKIQLAQLLRDRQYDPHDMLNRQLLAYVYIPIIQRECDIFVSNWNSHRIRHQDDLSLPTGVPNHMFSFPENYGGNHCGIPVTQDALEEVAEASGLLEENPETYMHDERIKHACEQCLPEPSKVDSSSAKDAYLFLKQTVYNNSNSY
jgi:hypothetical protein